MAMQSHADSAYSIALLQVLPSYLLRIRRIADSHAQTLSGALHALEVRHCQRVAIVDLDIHHGNGTEDIVKRFPEPSRLFFFSLHLFDKDMKSGYEFFPGSGASDDVVRFRIDFNDSDTIDIVLCLFVGS